MTHAFPEPWSNYRLKLLLLVSLLVFGANAPATVSAQPSVEAQDITENRHQHLFGDSVSANEVLTGNYAWDLYLYNAGSVPITKPRTSLLTSYSISLFDADPMPTVTRIGEFYNFTWNFEDVAPEKDGARAYLSSGFPVNFTTPCNSERITLPLRIKGQRELQEVTVVVSPQRSILRMVVTIGWGDETQTRSSLFSYSPAKDAVELDYFQIGSSSISWGVSNPSGPHNFSAVLSVINLGYPGEAVHKPRVTVYCSGLPKTTIASSGKTLQIRDPLLGQITYSAQGTYIWSYTMRVRYYVEYPEQEAFLHVENVSLATTATEPLIVTGANTTIAENQLVSGFYETTIVVIGSIILGVAALVVISRRKRVPEDRTRVYE